MLLIVEIALTIVAGKRGWKGWAALPILLGLTAGVAVGVVAAANGSDEMPLFVMAFAIDAIMVLTLIVMCAAGGPYNKQTFEQSIKSTTPATIQFPLEPPRPQPIDGYKMISQQSK